jgi:hypothetical protein
MDPWDTDTTRNEIERVYGQDQLQIARPCLRSLSDRQFYAQFHYRRAEETLKRYISTHLRLKDYVEISIGADEGEWNRFNVVIRKLGADVVACIQSLHSIPDILASAIYFSLQLNTRFAPKQGRFVNHAFVVDCLTEFQHLQSVQVQLKATVSGPQWRHLAALVNQAKHYSIVFPALNADFTGKRKDQYLLVFPEFTARGKRYPQVFVNELLPPIHEQLSRCVVLSGNALNQVLASRVKNFAKL